MAAHDVTLPDQTERRYTYGGTVAHVLSVGGVMPAYKHALCGYQPQWGADWLGSGSQNEEEQAAKMRLCRKCSEEILRLRFLRETRPQGIARPGMILAGGHKPHEGRCLLDGHRWPCSARLKEMRASSRAQAR